MSELREIDCKSVIEEIKKKAELTISDYSIMSYEINKKKQAIHMLNYFLSKEKEKKDEEKLLKIEEITQKIKKEELELENLTPYFKTINLTEITSVLKMMILKNPNKFNDYDYCLLDSLQDKISGFIMYLGNKTKRTFFGKNNVTIRSFKHIPSKKDFRKLYFDTKHLNEIIYDLSCYKIWTNDNKSVNGLVIHRDRKKYTKFIDNYNQLIEDKKPELSVWKKL